jgi:hypothetical protein
MKAEDIKGCTPMEIADKFGLQEIPDMITEVRLTAIDKFRGGIANEVPKWGRAGGNVQFDFMGEIIDENKFVNPRSLLEWLENQ